MAVSAKSRLLCFWFKLVAHENHDKLSSLVYRCLYRLYVAQVFQNAYLKDVENTLNNLGLSHLWLNQGRENISLIWFKEKVKRSLQDQYLQQWYMHVDNDEIFYNYRMFKPTFKTDPYFTLLPDSCVISLARFRTTNNVLPVNRLRFDRIPHRE